MSFLAFFLQGLHAEGRLLKLDEFFLPVSSLKFVEHLGIRASDFEVNINGLWPLILGTSCVAVIAIIASHLRRPTPETKVCISDITLPK